MVLIEIYTRGELFIFEFLTLSMCFVLSKSGSVFIVFFSRDSCLQEAGITHFTFCTLKRQTFLLEINQTDLCCICKGTCENVKQGCIVTTLHVLD